MGFSEILKDHPTPHSAYIGLHLISALCHGQGLGRQIYALLEDYFRQNLGVQVFQLAVALSNPVEGFWARLGDTRLPGSKMTLEDEITSSVFEMQKKY